MKNPKAHVDLSTGKIFHCEEGSWKWWHEKGHLVFNNDPNKSFLIMLKSYIFDVWMLAIMFSVVIKGVFYFAVPLWLAYFGIGVYEEMWCNLFAHRNYCYLNEKKTI